MTEHPENPTENLGTTDPDILLSLVYADPLTAAPRHLFIAGPDGRPVLNRIGDEELRDRLQPHWRVVRARHNAIRSMTDSVPDGSLRAALDRMGDWAGGWRRPASGWLSRDVAAAEQAWDTAEWIWNSDPLCRQRALDRERAEQALAAALRLFEERAGEPAGERAGGP